MAGRPTGDDARQNPVGNIAVGITGTLPSGFLFSLVPGPAQPDTEHMALPSAVGAGLSLWSLLPLSTGLLNTGRATV